MQNLCPSDLGIVGILERISEKYQNKYTLLIFKDFMEKSIAKNKFVGIFLKIYLNSVGVEVGSSPLLVHVVSSIEPTMILHFLQCWTFPRLQT